MWIINRRNLVSLVRSWLYVLSLVFWLVIVLVPVSIVAYLTFIHVLIPEQTISVPLKFSSENWDAPEAKVDLNTFIKKLEKQPALIYQINLNLELFCNRNRNDDIFRIGSTVQFEELDVNETTHFVVNCDSRYLYHQNNWIVPFNWRFWVSPILSDINKNVRVQVPYMEITGKQLSQLARKGSLLLVLVGYNRLVLNDQNTSLEFIVKWDGFRYYLNRYPTQSFIYGTFLFWLVSAGTSLFTAFIWLVGRDRDEKKPIKKESKFETPPTGSELPSEVVIKTEDQTSL